MITARYALATAALLVLIAALGQCGAHARPQRVAAQVVPEPIAIVSEPVPCCEDDEPPTPVGELDEVKLEALWLARTYVHEHGWPHRRARGAGIGRGWILDDEMPAMDVVLERVRHIRSRSERAGYDESYSGAALAYSHGLSTSDAASLTLDGEAPVWRSYIPWANRRDAWLLTIRHAIDVRLGLLTHRCAHEPTHWGCGPELSTPPRGHGTCRDHERAQVNGLCEVACGVTRDTFYRACDEM